MSVRPLDVVVEQRLREVYEMVLYGHSRWEILQKTAEWGLSERSIDTYISRASERLIEKSKETQERQLSRVLSHHWKNYRKAEERGDFMEARKTLEAISKISGLEHANLNVKFDRPLKEISDDELMEKLKG